MQSKQRTLTVLLAFSLFAAQAGLSQDKSIVRVDRDSRYYRIIVMDFPERDQRILYFSKSRPAQSIMLMSAPKMLALSYLQSMVAALALHDNPKDALLLGMGGAALPKFLSHQFPGLNLDVVEIDPDVVKVAQEHFEYQAQPNTNLYVMDGRVFLKRAEKKYDVIFLDAYTGDSLPFHLTTVEFYQMVRDHLKPGGVVAINLCEFFVNRFFLSHLKTLQTVFPQSYLFTTPDPSNRVAFATMGSQRMTKEDWVARSRALVRGKDLWYNLPQLVTREYEYIGDRKIEEKPLVDDMAPVDQLRMQRAGN